MEILIFDAGVAPNPNNRTLRYVSKRIGSKPSWSSIKERLFQAQITLQFTGLDHHTLPILNREVLCSSNAAARVL